MTNHIPSQPRPLQHAVALNRCQSCETVIVLTTSPMTSYLPVLTHLDLGIFHRRWSRPMADSLKVFLGRILQIPQGHPDLLRVRIEGPSDLSGSRMAYQNWPKKCSIGQKMRVKKTYTKVVRVNRRTLESVCRMDVLVNLGLGCSKIIIMWPHRWSPGEWLL